MEPESPGGSYNGGNGTRKSRRLLKRHSTDNDGVEGEDSGSQHACLTSPTLHNYFAPRKAPRMASRVARGDTLRHIRQRGYSGKKPKLTGHLGTVPREVWLFTCS
jgi:hypothetical protein